MSCYYPHFGHRPKFIAEAPHREKMAGLPRILLQLLAQQAYVNIYGTREDRLVIVPHVLEELLARDRYPTMLYEVAQQLELARRQFHRLPVAAHLGAPKIYYDGTESKGL